ncbi:hypothetical protein Q6249_28260, partial [Klebsiella pneumoniae]
MEIELLPLFRQQLPGVELYHAHISRYAFEPHT